MAETLSNGTVVNYDGLAPDYTAARERESNDRAFSLLRVALRCDDLSADARANIEGALDNLLIAKAAREAKPATKVYDAESGKFVKAE